MLADTVDIHIVRAEAIGTIGDRVVYKAEVHVMAGDTVIGAYGLYQQFHGQLGDLPSFLPPYGVDPPPANHPISKLGSTPTSRTEPIGHVKPETVHQLMSLGAADPDTSPAMLAMLKALDTEGAAHLAVLARDAMEGKVTGRAGLGDERPGPQRQGPSQRRPRPRGGDPRDGEGSRGSRPVPTERSRSSILRSPAETAPPKDVATLIKEVREQVAGEKPDDFEWRWSDADAERVVHEGRKLGLSDQQINDLIRIAQRKDQMKPDGTVKKKHVTPDEMIEQMHNYVEEVVPQGHPYRIDSKEQFAQFGQELREAAAKDGLPKDDVRVQGSALRKKNPAAPDIDVAILIDDRAFDAQLSSDGRRLAYAADQSADQRVEVFVSDVSTGVPTTAVRLQESVSSSSTVESLAFSHDGSAVVWASNSVTTAQDVWLAIVSEATPTPAMKVNATSPALSPKFAP